MSGASISYPHHHHHHHVSTYREPEVGVSASCQSRTELRSANNNTIMATCYPSYELTTPQPNTTANASRSSVVSVQQKDYSRPLHVDCSVEYELPNQAKPPAGVRNEPLLMIHPCYFRKIESQRRSPFVNNLPTRQQQQQSTTTTSSSTAAVAAAAAAAAKRRAVIRGQQIPQQVPQQAAQYPVQYAADTRQQLWEPMPPLVPITAAAGQGYCKRDALVGGAGTYTTTASVVDTTTGGGNHHHHHWTDADRSPDRPEDKHILTGKYRQYLRAHRLHPYVTSAIPIASTFPQIQQVCYNV